MERTQQQQPMDSYRTGIFSKDFVTEFDRLQALERFTDPTTIAIIKDLPLQPDWQCLEMGAGAGSIAYWLAEQCVAGNVVAADVDPRYLRGSRTPNLDVAQVDLAKHEFPAESFDLIHSRAVLSHIPQRDEVLRNALNWLRPGGWLVVEDILGLPHDDTSRCPTGPLINALIRWGTQQGSDSEWTRRMPGALAGLGLERIQLRMTPMTLGLGGASDELWRISLRQIEPVFVEKAVMTQGQINNLNEALDRGELADFSFIVVSAWGRRPMVV
jgi:ubiquinone/menaquinone biosynthesis C-methylase UbiE